MNLNIFEADKSHLDFILQAQVDLALETENLKLDEEVVKKGINSVFEDPNKGKYLVAKFDEELVGVLLIVKEWSEWRNSTVLWIHSLFIVKEHRGKGIYKSMYQHIKNQVLKSDKLAGIRLNVDKSNTKAVKVYQSLGMTDEHYRMFEWLK